MGPEERTMPDYRFVITVDIEDALNLTEAYALLRAGMAQSEALTNAWESTDDVSEDGDAIDLEALSAARSAVVEREDVRAFYDALRAAREAAGNAINRLANADANLIGTFERTLDLLEMDAENILGTKPKD
jgi:hypothetical protein